MMYVDFTAGEKDYKLRLNTRNVVMLEKQLGCNPLSLFKEDGSLPSITQMVAVLHASLQPYHHGITLDKAYDVFDAFLAENHTVIDFFMIIVEIYKVSGLLPDDTEETNEKN